MTNDKTMLRPRWRSLYEILDLMGILSEEMPLSVLPDSFCESVQLKDDHISPFLH